MMSEQPTLFPAPAIPGEARPSIQLAATAAKLCHEQLIRALTYGSNWTPDAAAEIGRQIAVAKSLHESLQALLSTQLS